MMENNLLSSGLASAVTKFIFSLRVSHSPHLTNKVFYLQSVPL